MPSCATKSGMLFLAVAASTVAAPVLAQDQASTSRPVVQPLPSASAGDLNAALIRIARNPNDSSALLKAGEASLKLGDVDAAIGFFSRADTVLKGDHRAKAGLASAFVRSQNPYDALLMFDEAERAGAPVVSIAGDRGLAHDLVGDNARAQQLYRIALAQGPDEEISRRLAVSLAITGDRNGAESTLRPLLERRDLPAYRTRAFAMAILGDVKEAQAIADVRLPSDMAARLAPYLRYMPRLTPAQKAAAANFGHFPKAVDIGRDDPRIAALGKSGGKPTDTSLIPKGEPLGRKAPAKGQETSGARSAGKEALRPAGPQVAASPKASAATAPAQMSPPPAATPAPPARPVAMASGPAAAPTSLPPAKAVTASPVAQPIAAVVPSPSQQVPQPEAPVRPQPSGGATPLPPVQPAPPSSAPSPVQASAPQPSPASPPVPSPAPPEPRSVAEAFADLALPAGPAKPAAGAVDVTRIKVKREPKPEPKVEAPPPKPKHPSRIWVQIGTGRDTDALAFDWRRLGKQQAKLFKGKQAYIAKWGRTNRLLTGPFPNEKAAQAFLADLKKAEVNSFGFTSKDGEQVEPLP